MTRVDPLHGYRCYSAAEPEAASRILPLAVNRGMAVLANRPLASGDLIARLATRSLLAWAGDIGYKNWAQILLNFCIAHPAVTCTIPGTRKAIHIRDSLEAGRDPLPDKSFQARIGEIVKLL